MECCSTATDRKSDSQPDPPAKLAGFAFANGKPEGVRKNSEDNFDLADNGKFRKKQAPALVLVWHSDGESPGALGSESRSELELQSASDWD
jgi:hypothetical protein